MVSITDRIQKSKEAGYSDEEIADFISIKDPVFAYKYKKSIESGYKPDEVLSFASQNPVEQPTEKTDIGAFAQKATRKGARLGMQYAKGTALGLPPVLAAEIVGQGASRLASSEASQATGFHHEAAKEIQHMLMKKATGNWSPQEEERLNEFYRLGGLSPQEIKEEGGLFEPISISPSKAIEKGGELLGIDTNPEDNWERLMDLAGILRGAGVKGAAATADKATSKLNKIFSPEVVNEAKSFIATAPIASSAIAAEDIFGVPEAVSLLGLSLGHAIAKTAKHVASAVGKKYFLFDPTNIKLTDLKNSWKQETAQARKYAEEQVSTGILSAEKYEDIKPFFETAEKYGIPITPSTITDSRYFKNMEKLIAENELTEEAAQGFRQQVAKDWASSTEKALVNMQTNLNFSSQGSVAEALMNDVTRAEQKSLKEEYSALYNDSKKGFEDAGEISLQSLDRLENSLTNVYNKVGSSLAPTSAETGAKEIISGTKERLRQSPTQAGRPELEVIEFPTGKELEKLELEQAGQHFAERKGKTAEMRARGKAQQAKERKNLTEKESNKQLKKIFGKDAEKMEISADGKIRFKKSPTASEIVDTIRSMNSTIEWDNPAVKNLLADTLNELKSILGKEFKASHPEAYSKYLEANQKFSQSAKKFGKDSRWQKWGIGTETNSEELLRTINSPEKLRQFEKEFGNTQKGAELVQHLKYLKAKETLEPIFDMRNFQPGDVAKGIDKLKRNAYFRYITPQETWSNLQSLASLDAQIERASSKFYSKAQPNKNVVTFFGDLKTGLLGGIGYKKLAQMSQDRRAEVFAEMFLDPKYSSNMRRIGEDVLRESLKKNPDAKKINELQVRLQHWWDDLEFASYGRATAATDSEIPE